MPALLPDDFSAGLEQVPDRAFSNWVAGDRASDECEQLRALAETIPVDELGRLHSALSQLAEAGEVTWRELDAAGVHKDSFLAILVALMASSDSDCAGTASAAYMAAARCSGAAAHGILHPMAAFELSKALRAVLCPAAPSSRAANPKAAPGRKRTKPDASDDWDDDRPHADTVWAAEAASDTRALVTSELSLLLQSVPLRAHPDVLASLVSALVAVATTDLATPKASSRAQSRAAVISAAPPHFDALALCLRIEHGDVARTAPLIFRALVPHMALDAAPASSTVPKELLAAQAACIDFVLLVAAHHPSAAAGGGAASAEETRSLLHSVQALLQRVSVAAPERAEARAQVCAALTRLVLSLPAPVAARFAQFLWRYGHTGKIGARTFAIEMSAAVLQLAASSAEAQAVLLAAEDAPQTCWRLVLQRVSDKAAGARTKALGCLAALLEALHAPAAAAVLHMVQQPLLLSAVSPLSGATPHQPTPQDGTDRRLSLLSLTEPTPGPASRKLPGSCASPATPADGGASPSASLVSAAKLEASLNGLGARLQQRCADERPAVRRVALLALEAWGVSTGIGLSRSQMAAIADRCQDSSPSIRKQAARSLTALLRLDPSSAAIRAAWIDGVLPLARDSEATVSDAAVEALEEMLVEPLSECATAPHQPPADSLWMLLAAIRPPSLPNVQHAIGALAARSRLPAKLAPAVQAVLAQEAAARGDGKAARAALWAILLQVAQPPPKAGGKELVEPVRLLDSWRAAARRGASHAADATGALRVVLCLARRGGLSAKAAAGLRQELLDQMKAMDGAPETVATIAQTCCALGELGTNDGWSQPLRAACAGTICVAGRRPSLATGTRDVQLALVIYGEVTLALSLAAPAVSAAAPEVVAAATDLAHGECEPALSATAFVALGKFCLGSASLANKLLPMFMRELGTNGQPAVRNNALIVLFDLVKRHTALFDRHLPTIALAIADTSPLVRHHAVVLLAQVRHRGVLFHPPHPQQAPAHACTRPPVRFSSVRPATPPFPLHPRSAAPRGLHQVAAQPAPRLLRGARRLGAQPARRGQVMPLRHAAPARAPPRLQLLLAAPLPAQRLPGAPAALGPAARRGEGGVRAQRPRPPAKPTPDPARPTGQHER